MESPCVFCCIVGQKRCENLKKLIIESPCFLQIRPTVQQSFVSLISERLQKWETNNILDAEDHSPLGHVLREIPYDKRMTILLRFPFWKREISIPST